MEWVIIGSDNDVSPLYPYYEGIDHMINIQMYLTITPTAKCIQIGNVFEQK